jgi:hypothetical protein
MDIVSIASFLLPTVLSMLFEGHGLLQGLPMPSPWRRMIKFSAQIYKKLTPGQKIKLVETGVLPPDFEKKLLDIYDSYLTTETLQPTTQSKLTQVLQTRKSETKGFPYEKYHNILMMIKPEEILKQTTPPYTAFKTKLRDLMAVYHPELNISTITSNHPSYPFFYAEWKKIHKILVEPKK